MLDAACVGAVVLAGGRGSRMGGVDKGLQLFRGQPLAAIALQRLRQQTLGEPGLIGISANRNLEQYAALGVPVWSDNVPDYAGPLAGFLAALEQCQGRSDYLLTVPCDSPLFPLDLLERLSAGLLQQQADMAVALAPEIQADGSTQLRPQPVFCLMRCSLLESLRAYVDNGGRKIGAWIANQSLARVAFDGVTEAHSFANANTLAELQDLEKQ